MSSLAAKLTDITGAAFVALGLPADLGLVRVSDRPDLAQFQCNGAMAAAKKAGKNPREVAQGIVDILSKHGDITNLEIAGPGFININVSDAFIAKHLAEVSASATMGVGDLGHGAEVILDYGGPNIAKPMHVGHLRSSIIGDTLRRIYKFAGYKTIGDVHLGDWGTHLGMLFSDYERDGKIEWVRGISLTNPQDVQALFDDMSERYPRASQACKSDEALMKDALRITKAMQDGQEPYQSAWQKIWDVSQISMKKNFAKLNVHFDIWEGEASVQPLIAEMVARAKSMGITRESDGALVIDVAEEADKKEVPPLILLKSDGAALYGTTDMATIADRINKFKAVKMIYVVDQRQGLHFEQVFRASRKLFALEGVDLVFAGFGTMNGTDGKPFKTRAGGVMKLEELIAMGVEKAQARIAEAEIAADLSAEERGDIAYKVAIAAIKFADLQNQRQSDYVFDLDRMTSFEGKTGPYMLYQVVRINSLLRKAAEQGVRLADSISVHDEDRSLALLLSEFPDHFGLALNNLTPHVLCDYAYKIAQAFSSFYGSCHILSESDANVRASRLALCKRTQEQLSLILELLGIEIPDRM